MYIGNNWMVCGTFYSGLPVNEYFIDEKALVNMQTAYTAWLRRNPLNC